MKHDRDGKESLPDPERDGIDAEEDDLADSVADRERLFSEVEPEGGRGVHVAVHVVHEVEAPEEGNDVVDAMPDPECVIEQHDGESDLDGPGEVHEVQYSEMSLLAPPNFASLSVHSGEISSLGSLLPHGQTLSRPDKCVRLASVILRSEATKNLLWKNEGSSLALGMTEEWQALRWPVSCLFPSGISFALNLRGGVA